jgi:hypothetical protein
MSMLSRSEFGGGNFTGQSVADAPDITPPLSFSANTNTSDKAATAWKSSKGYISKQNFGSTRSFSDQGSAPMPDSDRGVRF